MPLTNKEIWQRQQAKRTMDHTFKEKERKRAKLERDSASKERKERKRQQARLRMKKMRMPKVVIKDDMDNRLSRLERWERRHADTSLEGPLLHSTPDISLIASTPNVLRTVLPAVERAMKLRQDRSLSIRREKCVAQSQNKLLQRKVWSLQKQIATLKKSREPEDKSKIDRRNCIKIKKTYKRRTLQVETRRKVVDFLKRGDNSTCMPGKKDALKVNGKKEQVYILRDYLRNIYLKFESENVHYNCGFSSFCKARPIYIRLARYNSRKTCLCTHHQNMSLKLKALKGVTNFICDQPDQFIHTHTPEQIRNELNQIKTDIISFDEWKRVNTISPKDGKPRQKIRLLRQELTKKDFVVLFSAEADKFRQHVFRVSEQYRQIRILKNNLKPSEATLQMDFAQNYSCGHNQEIQSAYFDKQQVSIHPMVMHYKVSGEDELRHKSFVGISDDRSHNSPAVLANIRKIMPKIKEMLPGIRKIHYLTDSPTSQYRNRRMFTLVAKHEELFNIECTWTYFEAGHGKGPCDGVGGTIKRLADETSKIGKFTISDAESFFQWSKTLKSSMDIEFITSDDIHSCDSLMNEWTVVPVPNCLKLHAVQQKDGKMYTRETSCFSACCIVYDTSPSCEGWNVSLVSPVLLKNPGVKSKKQSGTSNQPRALDVQETSDKQPELIAEIVTDYKEGSYVAARYDGNWFIGSIINVDSTQLYINFMERAGHNHTTFSFTWPVHEDRCWIPIDQVISVIDEPTTAGSKLRPVTKISSTDMQNILKLINY